MNLSSPITPHASRLTVTSYTAAQIAAALGKSKRAVLAALQSVPVTSQVIVSGNPASAWALAVLPTAMREALRARVKAGGYRDESHLLTTPAKAAWPPSGFPKLSEIAQSGLDKAIKLQRALARVLALQTDLARPSAELEQIGLEDYRREFGFTITARALRALVKRTLERDGGAENLSRLELYLDERPARKAPLPSAPRPGDEVEFRELRDVLATFKQAATPTAGELRYLWLRAFELYEDRVAGGKPAKRTQRALVRFLFAVLPSLACHEAALRKTFKRKLARWQAGERKPEALADRRADNSGFHRAPELAAEDRDALIAHAVLNCDGRVSQAWRELNRRNALSEDLSGHYQSNPASKSYCPEHIREAVKYEVGMMADIHHGPRQDKLNGAHILRDWSSVAPLDWICGDDATLEVYFYTEDGRGGFTLMRGQFLVFICARTLRVLGFALLPERNYNARVIKTAIVKICDEHGLPREGFYFERGIWKNSRILKGDPNADPISWPEAELGLISLGLKFRHSNLPRSKPVERVIGALQDLMEGEPGYVGPDEMHEKFERTQRAKLRVERGEIHPSEHFRNLDEWVARLEEICAQYNATEQDGKMTGGLSPDAAFEKFSPRNDPPVKLPAGCRYLLAHHKRPVRVTSNGITLRFGKQVYNYRNEQTGRLRGQEVLAWFNPELPEILSVTDMNRENPFCVERTQEVPAMDAPAELLEQEFKRIGDHMSYARVRYRTLKSKFATPFRRAIVDAETAELGKAITAGQARITEQRDQEQKQQTRLNKLATALGTRVSVRPRRLEKVEDGLEWEAQLRRELQQETPHED